MTLRAGAIRFNADSSQLELYDGNQWTGILASSPDQRTGGGRGLFGGGCTSPGGSDDRHVNTIDFVTISSTGSCVDFGDLSERRDFANAFASKTRGFWAGGADPGTTGKNELDFITIASKGDATDFGNLQSTARTAGGMSDQTRGIIPCSGGGNVIEYITMSTTGGIRDFGHTYTIAVSAGAVCSPTRGVMGGGDSPSYTNVIQYLIISTLGNTADFGDLSETRGYLSGTGDSATRGLFAGGVNPSASPSTRVNTIDFITIATLGNALDFGDLTEGSRAIGGTSDCNRAVFAHGGPGFTGDIDHVNIATTGNAMDFGDSTQARRGSSGCSNAHGGLG